MVNPEFLEDLEFINDALSAADLGPNRTGSRSRSDGIDLAKPAAAHSIGAESASLATGLVTHGTADEIRLNQVLEQACLITGATGAAIALSRGEEMVCCATAGPDAPDVGACLDPRQGLSSACIQSRQLVQCNDTDTDPRVDAAACRELGVRSVVVLPLLDENELFGIFEILSSRPNAFGQRDLDSCRTLADRILKSRRQGGKAIASVHEGSGSSLHNSKEPVARNNDLPSETAPKFPPRARKSRRKDAWNLILGILIIGAAILLGTLVGWRLGWQDANHRLRANSPLLPAEAPSRTGQIDQTVRRGQEGQPTSASAEPCRQVALDGAPAQPQSDGLTVCQDGHVVFRQKPPAPSRTRNSQTSQRAPSLEASPVQR